jgi:nitrite reductase/ring-hydroxylating ferredoxin subunit
VLFESWDKAEKRLPNGEITALNLGNQKLAIVRQNKELFIFDRYCPHQHESLLTGTLNAFNEVICPLHEYRFNLNDGREHAQRCGDLMLYPVKIEGTVRIGLKE